MDLPYRGSVSAHVNQEMDIQEWRANVIPQPDYRNDRDTRDSHRERRRSRSPSGDRRTTNYREDREPTNGSYRDDRAPPRQSSSNG
ncbi:hypothetical protein LTR95_019723, partial [Oleoguttula sp. CCFEE 5521]